MQKDINKSAMPAMLAFATGMAASAGDTRPRREHMPTSRRRPQQRYLGQTAEQREWNEAIDAKNRAKGKRA